jgi:peptidoglycan hydrolase-like protein with peptidoglycan-binding domain
MIRPVGLFFLMAQAAFGFCGCDAIYRMVDKEGAQEKALLGEVMPFEQNYTVREVQTLLSLYGYNPGRIDGKLGNQTRNAIEKFQVDAGLKPTRFVDEETWKQLKIFSDYTLVVDGQLNAKLIQEVLAAAGHYSGKIDGNFGPRSQEAIKKFQEARGLKADGRIGYQTLLALSKFLVME